MKKTLLIILICLVYCLPTWSQAFSTVDFVNVLMGTQSKPSLSNGNTYPAIARPWGMNFWTPQTGVRGNGWTYSYDADKIVGLKQTHQPSPWINDYGQFSIMPLTGASKFGEAQRASWFSHKTEKATPYSYQVYLADHDILAQITPTERAAIMRLTFPQSDSSFVVVDAFGGGSWVKIIPSENKIIGYSTQNSGGVPDNFKNYFVVIFDKPFTYMATMDGEKLLLGSQEMASQHASAVIGFATKRGEVVSARIASSFISAEQACLNLRELGADNYTQIEAQGKKVWNDVLSRFEIDGGSVDEQRTFYSCLYRSLLFPRGLYEYDAAGKVVHYSPFDGKVYGGYMYTDTGFWDTFRCLFPLLNMMFPTVNAQIQQGLANTARESGFLPEWASPGHRGCMVGTNSSSVIADAYMTGVKMPDIELLYQTAIHGTTNVHPTVNSTGRLGYEFYNALGYVPYDVNINENAARTLEYSYNDWCLRQLAKAIKRPQSEIDTLSKRAGYYKNLFDKEHNLMRGRNRNGEFQTPYNPLKWGDAFTEGNAWHYTWSVFHDIQGLIKLMGGADNFTAMLDSVFSVPPHFDESYYGSVIHEIREMQIVNMGNYAHGNQPIQHMIYLYNYAAQPWKTQYWVRQVMDRLYKATPDGYCGDEDNGQTSAWYVFSAMGFYPVCPGSNEYVLGAPLFPKIKLYLENGKVFEIVSPENSAKNIYVEQIKLNGREFTKNYISLDNIFSGGKMEVKMGVKANKTRGISKEDFPYSMSNE
ncbi:MAG: GH92 family glycosyl hydrolase [Mucinivorans sp.]